MRVWMVVDGCMRFQKRYIATVPAVEQCHFHLCSATLNRIPCLK